jgi:hypothetical protein
MINMNVKVYSTWPKDEINFLKENFDKLKNKELSQILKRTAGSVARKKYELRLTKSIKWSKQRVIEELKLSYKQLNHSPTSRDVNLTLYQACLRYFGSFNKAKQEAGLSIMKPKHFILPEHSKSLTPKFAYILVVSLGDGHVSVHPGRKEVTLRVKDKDFAFNFMGYLKDWSERTPYFHIDNKGFYIVRLCSKDIAEFIHGFDIKDILVASKEIKCYFLKGLFDSEGCVGISNLNNPRTASRHIGFYNSNKNLVDVVSEILNQLNIKHRIRSRVHSSFGSKRLQHEIIITGFKNILQFKQFVNFSIERKEEKLNTLLKSYVKFSYTDRISTCFNNNEVIMNEGSCI